MSSITDLAKHIHERDNPTAYTPMFGKIIALPELKIQLGSRILLTADDVKATFDIYEKEYDEDGNFIRYANINKEVLLLPYSSDNKFVAIGVVQ